MTQREKLLAKARRAPQSLTFAEFEALLRGCGWQFKRQSGSHRIWVSPGRRIVPIQPRGALAKAYQVVQALRIIEDEHD